MDANLRPLADRFRHRRRRARPDAPGGTAADPWNAELPDWSGSMAATYGTAMAPAYGVFRYGNAAFLIVNTDDVPDVAVPTACEYNGFVGQAQLTALQTSLDQLSADK